MSDPQPPAVSGLTQMVETCNRLKNFGRLCERCRAQLAEVDDAVARLTAEVKRLSYLDDLLETLEIPADDPVHLALEALSFAEGAIFDAIGLEDGLDGLAGGKVLTMIRAALIANGRDPITIPPEDEAGDPPYQTTEQRLESAEVARLTADLATMQAQRKLEFDNHHNALLCHYCNPDNLVLSDGSEVARLLSIAHDDELARLRAENARLREERDAAREAKRMFQAGVADLNVEVASLRATLAATEEKQ